MTTPEEPSAFRADLFQGQTALVTGGTSGIGLAVARALSAHGCRMVVTGLTTRECERIRTSETRWDVRQLDVRSEQQVLDTIRSLDSLNLVVNAAGQIVRDAGEHELSGFTQTVDVNLLGTARVCYAARPLLAAASGAVLNVASMLSFFGSGFVPGYSASKGGVVQLTRSLAIAWAGQGIRVNAIAPGWIRTELTRPLYEDPQRSQPILERTPMKRWGEPHEVTGAVLYLCSSAARFVTGIVLPVGIAQKKWTVNRVKEHGCRGLLPRNSPTKARE